MIFCSRDARSIVLRREFKESPSNLFIVECLLLRHSFGAIMSNIDNTMTPKELLAYERTASVSYSPAYRLSKYKEQHMLLMTRYMTTDYPHTVLTQLAELSSAFTVQAIERAIVDCRHSNKFNSPAYIGAVLRNANTEEIEAIRRCNRYDEYIGSSAVPSLPTFVPRSGSLQGAIDDADRSLMVKRFLRELEQ